MTKTGTSANVGAQSVFTIAKAIYTNRWHDDPPWEFAAESVKEACRADARAAVAALRAAAYKIVPADPNRKETRDPLDGSYYAKDGKVWKAPHATKTDTGRSISMGFPVCTMHEAVGAEAAETVAALMNAGVKALAQAAYEEIVGAKD
jgi:hypothetical protein